MEDTIKKNLVLEEMRRAFDMLCATSDRLDTKLHNNLTFLSIIISVAASGGISILANLGVASLGALAFAFIFYFVALGFVVDSLEPQVYPLPISGNWETVERRYFQPSDPNFVLDVFIAEYLRSMADVTKRNQNKAKAVKGTYYLMILIVFSLIVSIALAWIFPQPIVACVVHLASCVK